MSFLRPCRCRVMDYSLILLESDHAGEPLAQPLKPRPVGSLVNLPNQVLKVRRLALGLKHRTLELKLCNRQQPAVPVVDHASTNPIAVPVLREEPQRLGLGQLLSLHRGRVVLVSLSDGLGQDVLELVVRTKGLLGPSGEDLLVDFVLEELAGRNFGAAGVIRVVPMPSATWRIENKGRGRVDCAVGGISTTSTAASEEIHKNSASGTVLIAVMTVSRW